MTFTVTDWDYSTYTIDNVIDYVWDNVNKRLLLELKAGCKWVILDRVLVVECREGKL
jgi:hypothetical protein